MSTQPSSEATTRSAYDTVAADYARLLTGTAQEHPLDLAMIDSFIAEVGPGPVLDAGAGAGRLTHHLATRGVDARGIDLSPRMIGQARRSYPDLNFETGSLLELPYLDASFAGVLLWYSVIHLTDGELERALAEVVRVTRPGGVVLIASQAGDGVVDLRPVYARMGHDLSLQRQRRTADVLASALTRAGTVELARLLRRGAWTNEEDDHAFVLARATR